jgi:adenine/guanine/hypoxanthine permease
MMRSVAQIDWADATEAIPAFLVVLGIPLAFSIADGMALGLIAYPVIKLLSGRGREVPWVMYLLSGVLIAYFIWIRGSIPAPGSA